MLNPAVGLGGDGYKDPTGCGKVATSNSTRWCSARPSISERQTQTRKRGDPVVTASPDRDTHENSVPICGRFDFLMPGYLGSASIFENATAPDRARRRLQPGSTHRASGFSFARLKRVANDRDKLEQVSFCDLTEPQRVVYRRCRIKPAGSAASGRGSRRPEKPHDYPTSLLRLRQFAVT